MIYCEGQIGACSLRFYYMLYKETGICAYLQLLERRNFLCDGGCFGGGRGVQELQGQNGRWPLVCASRLQNFQDSPCVLTIVDQVCYAWPFFIFTEPPDLTLQCQVQLVVVLLRESQVQLVVVRLRFWLCKHRRSPRRRTGRKSQAP